MTCWELPHQGLAAAVCVCAPTDNTSPASVSHRNRGAAGAGRGSTTHHRQAALLAVLDEVTVVVRVHATGNTVVTVATSRPATANARAGHEAPALAVAHALVRLAVHGAGEAVQGGQAGEAVLEAGSDLALPPHAVWVLAQHWLAPQPPLVLWQQQQHQQQQYGARGGVSVEP